MKRLILILALATLACSRSMNPSVDVTDLVTSTPTLVVTSTKIPSRQVVTSTVLAIRALNLREGAGVNHPVITTLPAGARVQVLGECVGSWVQVTQGKLTGWVNSLYLSGGVCK